MLRADPLPPTHDGRTATPRWQALDAARGAAVVAMIAYHFAWDLGLYRLVPVDVAAHPLGKSAARLIAGAFLFLVGVGLMLAHGRGLRWPAFLRRLALIAGAALLVTVASYLAFPDAYIFFGILHCIAVSSLLALPFLRAPAWLGVLAAALCFTAPLVLIQPALDAPLLAPLGLGASTPNANDYVPLFPWFGFVLAGLVAARLTVGPAAPSSGRSAGVLASLARAGRHSLPIYLLHQPLLLGVLFLVAQVTGPHPDAGAREFLSDCAANCRVSGGGDAPACERACACVLDGMRAEKLWTAAQTNRFTPSHRERLNALSQQCFAARDEPAANRP